MKLWQFLSVILILSISPLEISGQNNSGIVSGSVFNSGQEPLVGVSVFVKGTNIGTMTDADGRFSVKAEDGQSLEFRYIGYDTKVVTVNDKTMSVTMSENQVILDDVVEKKRFNRFSLFCKGRRYRKNRRHEYYPVSTR